MPRTISKAQTMLDKDMLTRERKRSTSLFNFVVVAAGLDLVVPRMIDSRRLDDCLERT